MEGDEKFHQRWEFRRKEVDGDSSSDDDRSNASGQSAVKRRNLVLLEDDEVSDHPECRRHDDDDNKQKTLRLSERKTKSRKKKQANEGCLVKNENKRKINPETEEIVMFKGLKDFSESLIQELAVSRVNMFAHMRDEMRELAARGMSRKEPKIKKNKAHQQKGAVRPKNAKGNACKYPKASDVAAKNDHRVLEVATKIETRVHMNFNQQVVSSPYLTLPTVIPNPSSHYLRSNAHIHVMNNSNPERDTRRLIDGTTHRSVGLFGQSFPQAQTASVPFPVPLSQETDYGSNISCLTYCESLFVDTDKMVPGMNGLVRFPRGNSAPSDQRFAHINMARKSDGEFRPVRPQEVEDGQFYSTSLRNHR